MLAAAAEFAPEAEVLRVVVVDDHRDVALAVAFALDALGHATRIAHDGPSALAAVVAHEPDLVLIDLVLPHIDGWALAHAIRALPLAHQPRLVAISGHDSPDDRARSAAAGFESHLAKPIAIEDIVRVVSPGN